MTAAYGPRRAGSVRFAPYYKRQRWDPLAVSWIDHQEAYTAIGDAVAAAIGDAPRVRGGVPVHAAWRIVRVSMKERVFIDIPTARRLAATA